MAEVQPLTRAAERKCRAIHGLRVRGRPLLTPPGSKHIARIGRISLRLWETGKQLTNRSFKSVWLIDVCSAHSIVRKAFAGHVAMEIVVVPCFLLHVLCM